MAHGTALGAALAPISGVTLAVGFLVAFAGLFLLLSGLFMLVRLGSPRERVLAAAVFLALTVGPVIAIFAYDALSPASP